MKAEDKIGEKKENTNKKSNLVKSLKKANSGFAKLLKKLQKVKINKKILRYCIVAIVALVLVIGLGKLIFKEDVVTYPLVFNTSEGDLYLLDSDAKNGDDALKLAVSESVSNMVYANNINRYLLFKKGSDLYLYDAKAKEETTKIVENVKSYIFSLNDKYVVSLDNDDNLSVYNYKKNTKIESDISEIIAVSEDKVIFEKDSVIYIRSINPKKEDREKITAEYGSYMKFSEDGKNVIYINKENDLISYNTKKNKENKIASNVKNYYCDNESCEKMFYLTDEDTKTIYYYDKKETKVAEGIYAVLATDVKNKQVVYSITDDGKYTIYFQTVGKNSSKIEDNLTSIRTLKIYKGKEIYYITGKNEVKYARISNNKIAERPKSLGADVTGYLYLYKDGYAFVSDVDSKSNGTLYIAKNGKAKKIDTDVNSSIITVNKDGSKIYYYKDYDITGTLYVTSGSKNKKIDENVYTFTYINDDLLYYIKDYSTAKSRGDLFIYRKGKTIRVKESVSRIASSPFSYKLK